MNHPAWLFNVVGAAYIPERHLESDRNHARRWPTQRGGLGVPWLARDLHIAAGDAAEAERALSERLK